MRQDERGKARAFLRALPSAAGVVALGALVAAGQAPLGFWWLALPALAAVTRAVARGARLRTAAATGWLAGAGYCAAAMFWIVDPFYVEPGQAWMAPFALVLMAAGMGVFWALAAAAGHLLGRGPRGRAAGFAVGLAASGLLRSYLFGGFPWALVGQIWVGTWVAQADALAGQVALSLATALVAALPLVLGRSRGTAAAAVLLGAAALFGGWKLGTPMPAASGPVVRLVQPDIAQSEKWIPANATRFFDRLLRMTAEPARGAKPDLIVWPETSVPFLLNRPGDGLQMIAEAAGGVPVALGITRTEGLRAYNTLAVLGPQGAVTARYDKHHLVPFGEFIPLGDLYWRLTGDPEFSRAEGYGYSAGPGPETLALGGIGRVLPLICYEGVFPQDLRVRHRPDWILQVTDDGWFGTLSGPYQHLAQLRLRAIETGLPVLRVAQTGVSAVIDARGRMLQSLPLGAQGVIDAQIPPALAPPPYVAAGDWPALALILAAAALLRLRRRAIDPDGVQA